MRLVLAQECEDVGRPHQGTHEITIFRVVAPERDDRAQPERVHEVPEHWFELASTDDDEAGAWSACHERGHRGYHPMMTFVTLESTYRQDERCAGELCGPPAPRQGFRPISDQHDAILGDPQRTGEQVGFEFADR